MKISYPRGILKEDTEDRGLIVFEESQLIDLCKERIEIEIRSSGNLRNKAFYLHSFLDWVIIRDNKGSLCLVPVKEEGE